GGVYVDGSSGGTIKNCILYGNRALSGVSDYQAANSPIITFSYLTPSYAGAGNLAVSDPQFMDYAGKDYRLRPGSPCLHTGTNLAWMTGATDLDGNPRISPTGGTPDMGCYEYPVGALDGNLIASPLSGLEPVSVVLTAYTQGTNTSGLYYKWGFTNSSVVDVQGSDRQVATNLYAGGIWSVTLTVTNGAGEADTCTRSNYLSVGPLTNHVWLNGGNVAPYVSWANAATSLQAAVNAAVDGTTVLVTNGVYAITNTLTIGVGAAVRSVNGASGTLIRRVESGGSPEFTPVRLDNSQAVLDGFTVTNGFEFTCSGVYLTAGTLRNCILRLNGYSGAYRPGAPVYMVTGLVENCTVTSNYAWYGAGAINMANGTVRNCIIDRNTAYEAPVAGVQMTGAGGVVRNCLIVRNTSQYPNCAGGVSMSAGAVENCTVAGNSNTSGGVGVGGVSASGGTLRNTIIYSNAVAAGASTNYSFSGASVTYGDLFPPYAGAGNIASDPLFVNAAGGVFTLQSASPCIDRGTNLAWALLPGAVDLAGHSRRQGAAVDMGCYELRPRGTLYIVR
ncbi:MAG: choice-of-anchor Q domain-containing protein, partial [Planctomycetota bacterium]